MCPHFNCNFGTTLHNLAKKNVPKKIFNLIEEKKTSLSTSKVVEKELKGQEARLRKEHDDLLKIKDEDEREEARMRLDIVNQVLTLRYPRCKMAFLDYTGCAALTCANVNCKAGFCAICLKDCGADAHAHVVDCPDNASKNIYVRDAEFNEHNRKRRKRIINEKLIRLSHKTRGLLLEKIGKDLADLGIKVNTIQRVHLDVDQGATKSSLENMLKEQEAMQRIEYEELMKIKDKDERDIAHVNYFIKYLS